MLQFPSPARPQGFRAFSLSDSNFVPWDNQGVGDAHGLAEQLDLHIHHTRTDRTLDDMLFEILTKEGYPPAVRIESKTVGGKSVFDVADGLMMICLDGALTLDLIRTIADLEPQRVVCLDEGFSGNDQLKANAGQIFKSKGIVFRTV